MTGDRDEGAVVNVENVFQSLVLPNSELRMRLPDIWPPEQISLGETGLDGVRGKLRVDVRLGTAAITSVLAISLAEELVVVRVDAITCVRTPNSPL